MSKVIAVLFLWYLLSKVQRLRASDDKTGVQCICNLSRWSKICTLSALNSSQSLNEIDFENKCGEPDLSRIKNIKLLNFTLIDVPGVLLEKFNRLTSLTIKNAGIQIIDNQQLEGGSDYLATLDLSYNEIKALQKNQFEHLLNIESIDLSHNMIEAIDDDAFELKNRYELTINLRFNRIKFFKQEWLFKSNNAIFAILDHNEITKADNILINGVNFNERSFEIKHNKLTNIVLNNFTDSYNFAFNEITEISCKESVDNILYLNISHNQILKSENFYDCMSKMINLKTLDLSFNNLGTEPYLKLEIFAELSSLEVLSLAGNKFSFIPYGFFSYQKILNKLDLSYNQFHILLEPKTLISLRNLKSLDLSFSGIRSGYELLEMEKVLTNLRLIGIEGNEFSCKCLGHFILQLEKKERINIMDVKNTIKKASNIDGIICNDENRNGEDLCNQN